MEMMKFQYFYNIINDLWKVTVDSYSTSWNKVYVHVFMNIC